MIWGKTHYFRKHPSSTSNRRPFRCLNSQAKVFISNGLRQRLHGIFGVKMISLNGIVLAGRLALNIFKHAQNSWDDWKTENHSRYTFKTKYVVPVVLKS